MNQTTNDVNLRGIGRAVAFGVVCLIVINVGVWLLFRFFQSRDENIDVRRSVVTPEAAQPTEPSLQVSPRLDWRAFRQQQLNQLNSYGWVSRAEGTVRIPINRAMELLVQRQSEAK
jgi:hypothetical protein